MNLKINLASILNGMTVIVSNNVTADYAAIVISKTACTWVQGAPLKTITEEKDGQSRTVRSWEYGVAQLRNPKAVCLIDNTDA